MSVERMVITNYQACQSYFDLTARTIIMEVCAKYIVITLCIFLEVIYVVDYLL